MDEEISIDVHLVHETPAAWLVHEGDPDLAVWIPKSKCQLEDLGRNDLYRLWIPEWLAMQKDLI